jgi:hypothetical protein
VELDGGFLGFDLINTCDEVLTRQCPCLRAFDLWSVLGIRRTRRRSINDEGHTNFTQVHVPSVGDRYCNDPGFYQILRIFFFAFVMLEMIEISQEFKTFESI